MKNKLKFHRAMLDIPEELANKLDVNRKTTIAIEKNNKYGTALGLAFKIAKFFGVKIEDIFIDE